MNKKEYIDNLLALCTVKQKELFNRMYPNSVNNSQMNQAITQIENTLRGLNEKNEEYNELQRRYDDTVKTLNNTINEFIDKFNDSNKELADANARIDKLNNPVDILNADTQERLDLMDALEAAGVDNWSGYSVAMDILEEQE